MSDGTNVLAEDWRPRVEAAWDCRLSSAQVSFVEVSCSLTVLHLRVDADLRARVDAIMLSPRVLADGEKRHKKMAQLARDLREMVVADLSGQHKGYRLSFKTYPNSPLGGLEGLIGLITFLERLEEEAKLPAPDQLLAAAGVKKGRKRGRPRSSDPWSRFIVLMSDTYTEVTGRPPPPAERSAFVNGLRALHDAFPEDVRMKSALPFGSRVREMLDPDRKNKRCKRRT